MTTPVGLTNSLPECVVLMLDFRKIDLKRFQCDDFFRKRKHPTTLLLYVILCNIWVCLKMTCAGGEVCLRGLFRGVFRGSVSGCVSHSSSTSHLQNSRVCFVVCFEGLFRESVSPKSNFPALLEVAYPQKIQTRIHVLYTSSTARGGGGSFKNRKL